MEDFDPKRAEAALARARRRYADDPHGRAARARAQAWLDWLERELAAPRAVASPRPLIAAALGGG